MAMATSTSSPTRLSTERRRLVREHLGLVRDTLQQVGRRLPAYVDRDDLYGAGAAALVDAGLRFDAGRMVEFPAFAAKRVRGAMLDELRRSDLATRSVRAENRRRARAVEALEAQLGREPRAAEVAAALGVDVDQLHRTGTEARRATVQSLDDPGPLGIGEVSAAATPADIVVACEVRCHVLAAVDALPERERRAVAGYFLHERPMRELAAELGVTESRVSQLRKRGLALLHETLAPYLEEQAPPAAADDRSSTARLLPGARTGAPAGPELLPAVG